MKHIKKILVPTDFSENAISAYTHAEEIARRFGAKVDFIHIIPTLHYFSESMANMSTPLDWEEELYPKAQEDAKKRLAALMNEYLSEEYRGEAFCKIDRKISSRIAGYARDEGHDLIIMAMKGKHNSNLLRGSTAEQVIRFSEVPVFTVDARLSSEGLKRILMPTDGSVLSFSALPLTLSLAEIYDAEITLYHVFELYGSLLNNKYDDPDKSDEANAYEAIMDCLNDYLSNEQWNDIQLVRGDVGFDDQLVITDGVSSHAITVHTVIEKRVSAHLGIEEYAEEHADVVVMATHGHSGFAHLFLGSTTEKVAQYLDIPVLTVKPLQEKLAKKER